MNTIGEHRQANNTIIVFIGNIKNILIFIKAVLQMI